MSDLLRELCSHLRLPFWHRADIEAEIRSHLQEAESELRAQGADDESARRGARERFGDAGAVGEALQSVHCGWGGGATVQARLARLVLLLVVAAAAVTLWWSIAHQALPLWYAVLWFLAAAAVGWHRGLTDWFGGSVWAGFALLSGPIAWLCYLLLLGTRLLPRPVGRTAGRLLWGPRAAVAATIILIGAPAFALPLEAAGLDTAYARSGMQALGRVEWGVPVLLRAATSRRPALRRAALAGLRAHSTTAGGRGNASDLSQWAALLRSPYAEVRDAAWEQVDGFLHISYREAPAEQLFAAWRTALASTDPNLAKAAWNSFSTTLAVSGVRNEFAPIANRLPELLRLGRGRGPELGEPLSGAVEGALRAGCAGVNPDDYGIPLARQMGLLPLRAVAAIGGELSIGEIADGHIELEPREGEMALPVPPYSVATSSPDVEAWTWMARPPGEPGAPSVTVYYAITARGPEGKHEAWIDLTGSSGSRLGLVKVTWTEVAHPVRHCPLWEAARPQREARLARLRETGRL